MLCDGAMGTLLYERAGSVERCFDELNLSQASVVQQAHRDYLTAGADIIETNTFGANRFKLANHRLQDQVAEINRRGAKNGEYAVEVTGRFAFVAGSIGPTGRTLAPIGLVDPEEVRAAFREQVEGLLAGGVDLLMIETIGALEEMTQAVLAARDVSDLPIVAQMTFSNDGRTIAGQTVEQVAEALTELNVEVIGVNCSVGPRGVLRTVQELRTYLPDGTFISAQPNAGWPTQVDDRIIYSTSPEYFARFASEAIEAGATIVGGCCGTTPEHTAAMRDVIDRLHPVAGQRSTSVTVASEPQRATLPADQDRKSVV